MQFQTFIDLTKHELRNAVTQVLASAPSSPVQGLRYFDSTLGHEYVWNGSGWEQASGASGSGTVTSVALAVPSWLSVSGSPITSSGTITVAATAGQTANQFLATPNGTTGAVSLRAIVSGDVPKTLDHSWITDFDTQVRTSRLDQMAAPTASVSLNSQKATNAADPTAATDLATKNYVDLAIQGLPNKVTANWATTAALPACTYANGTAGVGATLTGNANGALATQDGQAPAAGDVALVKNQAAAAQNGLYTVTQVGDGTHPFILTRHVDMDSSAEFGGGWAVVENGSTQAGSLWLCTANSPTVGTTNITFTEMNKAADLAQGTGIAISGNTISLASGVATAGTYTSVTVDTYGRVTAGGDIVSGNGLVARTAAGTFANRTIAGTASVIAVTNGDGVAGNPTVAIDSGYVGQASITTLGTIGTGTWQGTAVGVSYGGTGSGTAAGARTNLNAAGVYSATFGDGSATSFTITQATHGLASNGKLIVQVYEDSSGNMVIPDVAVNKANGTVTISGWTTAPSAAFYRVVIMG